VIAEKAPAKKELVGVDVFLDWRGGTPDQVGEAVQKVNGNGLKLEMISNRGLEVWPGGVPETLVTDHWRCRFLAEQKGNTISQAQIISLLGGIEKAGLDFIKAENLFNFDGKPGYSGAKE
jgi:isocitrate dehydrogenase